MRTVAFSADGRTLVTGSGDNTAIVWGVANPLRPSREDTLAGHTNFVSETAFSPAGDLLAVARWDRTVTLWRS